MDEIIHAKYRAWHITGIEKLREKRAVPSSPSICYATHNRAIMGCWELFPQLCPTPLQQWQVEVTWVGTAEAADGSSRTGERGGGCWAQSLSSTGFPWLPSSLRSQVSGPPGPLPQICCQCSLPPSVSARPTPCTSPSPALHLLVLGSWCVGGQAGKEQGEEGPQCAESSPATMHAHTPYVWC